MSINYQKQMFENLNLGVIFEVEGTQDVIPCQPLLELSRLINLNDSHTITFSLFRGKHVENDIPNDFIRNLEINSITTSHDDQTNTGVITFTFPMSIAVAQIQSAIIFAGDKKLLIINDEIRLQSGIVNGKIELYYG